MKTKVFISYTQSDENEVGHVESTLRKIGLDIWKDRYNLTLGLDIEAELNKAINNQCDIVLVIMSAESLYAEWVKWEQKRAEDANKGGSHIQVIYVKVKEFQVPDEIKKRLYVDYSFPPGEREDFHLKRQIKATETLAQFFVNYKPLRRIGVYNVYCSYDDLNQRREKHNSIEGCNIHEFIESAEKCIVAVGFSFENFFGPDYGSHLATWAKDHCDSFIDMYVPNPRKAPLDHLKMIYPYGNSIPKKIKQFIDYFKTWGREMQLQKNVARRFRLHLLSCCPTHSLLAIDIDETYGRMIADITSFGKGCDYQMKVEFRYPQTLLYKRYRESLRRLALPKHQTNIVYTNSLEE